MPTQKLKNTVLITGGAKRIGKALAQAFHKEGYSILLHYHQSREAAESLCSELNQQRKNSALCLACALDDADSLRNFIKKCKDSIDDLQLLINNASRFYPKTVEDSTESDWQQLMDSNLRAPFFLSQAFIPELSQSKGDIINLVDIHAERPLANHSIYSASKAGLVNLSKSLALDLAPDIRVNGIAPGAILWPEAEQNDKEALIKQQALLDKVALKRKGNEQDIVGAALYLHQADYVTGQIIQVDGGRSLNI